MRSIASSAAIPPGDEDARGHRDAAVAPSPAVDEHLPAGRHHQHGSARSPPQQEQRERDQREVHHRKPHRAERGSPKDACRREPDRAQYEVDPQVANVLDMPRTEPRCDEELVRDLRDVRDRKIGGFDHLAHERAQAGEHVQHPVTLARRGVEECHRAGPTVRRL